MFLPIKNLGKIDYLMLLDGKKDLYYNDEINKVFDLWNKKYGNNIVFDEDDKNKSNLNVIADEVKKDLHKIELDDNKIINSLVSFLYKKPSTRKKKLLWYVYGEELYNNLVKNIDTIPKNVCHKCGKRTNDDLVNGKCFSCRQNEIKDLNGNKLIKCVDCGKEIIVGARSRTIRCEECAKLERRRIDRERKRRKK